MGLIFLIFFSIPVLWAQENPVTDSTLTHLKLKYDQGRSAQSNRNLSVGEQLTIWYDSIAPFLTDDDQRIWAARGLNNLGVLFKQSGKISESRDIYLRAIEILSSGQNPNQYIFASITSNSANVLKQLGDYNRSIEYSNQAIRLFTDYIESSPDGPYSTLAKRGLETTLNNLALTYQETSRHQEALALFDQILLNRTENKNEGYYLILYNEAVSYYSLGDPAAAKERNDIVYAHYSKEEPENRLKYQAQIMQGYIEFAMKNDSLQYLRDIKTTIAQLQRSKASVSDMLITVMLDKCNHLINLKYLNQAQSAIKELKLLITNEPHPDVVNDPAKYAMINRRIELINTLRAEGRLYDLQYDQSESLKKLKESYGIYLASANIIDRWLSILTNDQSKTEASRLQRITYNNLVDITFKLYEITNDQQYVYQAFEFFERSKAAGLWSSIQDSDIRSTLLPADILSRQDSLLSAIADLQGELSGLKAVGSVDQTVVRAHEEDLFRLNTEIDSLQNWIKENYADYYRLKWDRTVISLDQVRGRLTNTDGMIDFYITNSLIHTILIQKDTLVTHTIPLTGETFNHLNFLIEFVQGNKESFSSQAMIDYALHGSQLYEELLSPLLEKDAVKHLIIIPDGILNLLSFDILLSKKPDPDLYDYSQFPFLIKKYKISYAYNASLMYWLDKNKSSAKNTIMAIAPSYGTNTFTQSDFLRAHSSELPALHGTIKEAKDIHKIMGGKSLIGEKAQEEKFKQLAGDYQILHLAMHTILNQDSPDYSALIFSPGADRTDDGILYSHELYNLQLNAKLIVLSACGTGSGKLATGEGIISMARGFVFAGCPALVMTLWMVDDRASEEIIHSYYTNISKGLDFVSALQESKLTYIENAGNIRSHPHFWAGFIHLGQTGTIAVNTKPTIWILSILFGIILIILVTIIIKKKSRS